MRRAICLTAVFAIGLSFAGLTKSAIAADAKPAGTWKWEVTRQNGEKMEVTLKLKQEGEKISGTITGRNNTETEIKDAKLAGDELTFTVEREFNGNKMVWKYKAKVEGDTMKGKSEVERDGQVNTRDFEAKRAP